MKKKTKNPLPKDFNKDLRDHRPVKKPRRKVATSAKKHKILRRVRRKKWNNTPKAPEKIKSEIKGFKRLMKK